MSINIKKYTKDQMAKMVEDAQAEVQELKRVNATLTERISQMNGEAINNANEIEKLKADFDSAKNSAQHLNDQGQQYWRAWQASKREVADLKNKLADTEAALGRVNAELTRSVAEKNTLRNYVTKMVDRAAFECRRADYAESHPWRNLWAWVKRKLVRHE
jgi:chromosome segregation ATPase|nr:MAG TPA: outer capsid protein sigma-1 attachment protein [Caudoviricetes sp.]